LDPVLPRYKPGWTIICAVLWGGNQLSGNQFVTPYAPTLVCHSLLVGQGILRAKYVALGRSSQAYMYSTIKAVIGLISTLSGGLVVDMTGRRVS
jgi:hypothetical protein